MPKSLEIFFSNPFLPTPQLSSGKPWVYRGGPDSASWLSGWAQPSLLPLGPRQSWASPLLPTGVGLTPCVLSRSSYLLSLALLPRASCKILTVTRHPEQYLSPLKGEGRPVTSPGWALLAAGPLLLGKFPSALWPASPFEAPLLQTQHTLQEHTELALPDVRLAGSGTGACPITPSCTWQLPAEATHMLRIHRQYVYGYPFLSQSNFQGVGAVFIGRFDDGIRSVL